MSWMLLLCCLGWHQWDKPQIHYGILQGRCTVCDYLQVTDKELFSKKYWERQATLTTAERFREDLVSVMGEEKAKIWWQNYKQSIKDYKQSLLEKEQ